MKAMQDKIIAIITNMVLAMALIVVAGTISSDVTGSNEGEQGKLEGKTESVADVNASLLGTDDLFVSVPVEGEGVSDEAEDDVTVGVTDDYNAEDDVCNVEDVVITLDDLYEYKYEDMFLVNVSSVLNVRAEADVESDIVGKIYAGQGGKVLWQDEEWSLVRSGNVLGYIKNEYAWFDEEIEEHVEEKGQLFAVVTATKLRVRAKASTSSTTLGMVLTDERLEVLEYGEEWTTVRFEQATGFVSTDYIYTVREVGTGLTLEEEKEIQEAEAARQAALKEEEERRKREEQEALERAIENSGVAEIVQTGAYNLSTSDIYLLACCVSAEVGSSSYECQLAVANVILNRLKTGAYGDMTGVIYAKNQFSVARNGALDRYLKNGPKAMSVKAVEDALAGNNNMVGYYNFCYLPAADFDDYSSYIILGSEVFYRRK